MDHLNECDEKIATVRLQLAKLQQARKVSKDFKEQFLCHHSQRQRKINHKLCLLQQEMKKTTPYFISAMQQQQEKQSNHDWCNHTTLTYQAMLCHKLHRWSVLTIQKRLLVARCNMERAIFEQMRKEERAELCRRRKEFSDQIKSHADNVRVERKQNYKKLKAQKIVIKKLRKLLHIKSSNHEGKYFRSNTGVTQFDLLKNFVDQKGTISAKPILPTLPQLRAVSATLA
mmetsp:Transcript_246/g.368  ORF Transcript_246/g.368 Transcript_246/m.368 type:complete len:229 (+) Transcript_246:169-855(+)